MSAGAPLTDDQNLVVGSNWNSMKAYILRLANAGSIEKKYMPILDPELGIDEKNEKKQPQDFEGEADNDDATPQPQTRRKCSVKRKLALLAVVGFLAYKAVPFVCHRRHHHDSFRPPTLASAWEQHHSDFRNELPATAAYTAADYNPSIFFEELNGVTRKTANATIPVQINDHDLDGISVQFFSFASRILVSRADEAALVVESQWDDDEDMNVNWANDGDRTYLSVSGSTAVHTLHIILPPNQAVPSLRVAKAGQLEIALHDSAKDTTFEDLTVLAQQLTLAEAVVGDAVIATKGDITGSYNVSRSLHLITKDGSIDADINAVPPPHPPHRHPPPPDHTHFAPPPEGTDEPDHPDHPKHPDHPHPPHRRPGPPGRRPHGPPPINILALAHNDVHLRIHKPWFVRMNTATRSEKGSVKLFGSRTFHGAFAAGTRNGTVEIKAGPKKVHIVHERVTDHGRFVRGFVAPLHHKHNGTEPHPHPPHHPPHHEPKEPKEPETPEEVDGQFEKRHMFGREKSHHRHHHVDENEDHHERPHHHKDHHHFGGWEHDDDHRFGHWEHGDDDDHHRRPPPPDHPDHPKHPKHPKHPGHPGGDRHPHGPPPGFCRVAAFAREGNVALFL